MIAKDTDAYANPLKVDDPVYVWYTSSLYNTRRASQT